MSVKICESCGTPVKKLKHSIKCLCGSKIISGQNPKVKKRFVSID